MKELLPVISDWTKENQPFAIATVIKTWGSAPRPMGAALVVSKNMEMAGSVSGGCIEGAVIKAAMPLIEKGFGKMLNFGVTDAEAWEVGLSCGGKITVFIERFLAFDKHPAEREVWRKLQENWTNNQPCILFTRLQEEEESRHILVMPDRSALGRQLSTFLIDEGIRAYKERKHQIIEWEGHNYFAQVFPRKSQLLIIGAAHITADLVQLGKLHDFETIVIDPRGIFAKKTKFASPPDQIIEKYPSEALLHYDLGAYTYAVVLSHDPKIDDNALHILLRSDIAYIGALGSRKTQAKRVARLQKSRLFRTGNQPYSFASRPGY